MTPVEFDAIVLQEGNTFVAHCLELDVSSCGQDLNEARRLYKDYSAGEAQRRQPLVLRDWDPAAPRLRGKRLPQLSAYPG